MAEVVFGSGEHLSVDEIEHVLRSDGHRIGKATIYRALDLLVRSKLVAELDFGEGFKRYEHRLSARPIHEHLICLNCGAVIEFQSAEGAPYRGQCFGTNTDFGPRATSSKSTDSGRKCTAAGVEVTSQGLTCPIETV